MDCLRSFVVSIDGVASFTGTDVKTWTLGLQEFWAVEKIALSTFETQGFKNIDVYGISMNGIVQTERAAVTGGCVVQDWGFEMGIQGQLPLASGIIVAAPNYWNIQTTQAITTFALSKNSNYVKFADPIKSVKNFRFENLKVQGIGGQTVGTIALDWDLNFTIYYKYEGE